MGGVFDFLRGAATGFPDTPTPTWFPTPDRFTQPAGASVAPTVPLVENLGEMDREWGWTAPSAVLGGGGAGRADRGSSLEAIEEALLAQSADSGNWWDRATGFVGDVVGSDAVGALGDAAGWLGDQYGRGKGAVRDAWGNIIEGDLSEAVGDLAGGAWDVAGATAQDVGLPVLGYLGKEAGQMGVDLLDNVYRDWLDAGGLDEFVTGLPGQLGGWGQAGLQRMEDLSDFVNAQAANAAKWGGSQFLNLGGEVGDFVTQQAIPYFQQDFLEDATNLGQGVADWAVDDAWGQAIQPFYENVLKPAGLDIADWAVDDVYKDIITPLYENYLKPAGLAVADFTTEEAWPYIRDHLRHDISDVLEKVPAFIRNVLPEGSRVDAALEAAVGGVGSAFDFFTEDGSRFGRRFRPPGLRLLV
jgi:hypothetical protein